MTWTDGATFPPGFPVTLFLRLVPQNQKNNILPKLTIKLRVIPVVGDGFSREADPAPDFRVFRRQMAGWETEIRDAFNSSIPPPYESKRPGAQAFQRGAYLISIFLKVGDDAPFEINDIPIAVTRTRETNSFWKTNPDRIGDFLPELKEEELKIQERRSNR
jgi:hypothetical protein